jgi:15-cis-phytoene synthase
VEATVSHSSGDRRLEAAGSSFLVAFRVLPAARREAVRAVYAFCRSADDAVDEAPGPADARAGLERVRLRLEEAFRDGGSAADPETRRLGSAIRAFGLPREPFDDLLEGVSWDLEGRRYSSAEELREYCIRVASTVGALCIRIFGCEDPGCDRYAEELGVALQWTNILRDIGEDLGRGRVYLPGDALRRHGLDEAALRRGDAASRRALDALILEQAAYARERFRAARVSLPRRERRRALAGEIMGAVYRVLLHKVERAGSGVLDRRVRVSGARRVAIAVSMLLRYGVAAGAGRTR